MGRRRQFAVVVEYDAETGDVKALELTKRFGEETALTRVRVLSDVLDRLDDEYGDAREECEGAMESVSTEVLGELMRRSTGGVGH